MAPCSQNAYIGARPSWLPRLLAERALKTVTNSSGDWSARSTRALGVSQTALLFKDAEGARWMRAVEASPPSQWLNVKGGG